MKRTIIAWVSATIVASVLPNTGIAGPPIKSNQMVPVDIVVEGRNENIAIHGTLHVVTEVRGTSLQVHTNLANAISIGLTSGLTSPVAGTQSFSMPDAVIDWDGTDVMAVVQWLVRESYLDRTEDLKAYAKKVAYYNQLKLTLREGFLISAVIEPFPCDCSDCDDGGSD